jgi:hypothetical protein
MITHFAGGNTVIEWDKLLDQLNDQFVNDATVTFTVRNASGAAISGAENIPMPYRAGTNGRYRGLLLSTVELAIDGDYWIEITATKTGFEGFRREQLRVQYKGSR